MGGGFWGQYVLALIVVGLMLLGLWMVVRGLARGRMLGSANRRLVTVLESTMLSQHAGLFVVKVGERYLLLGGGKDGSVATLAELPSADVEGWIAQHGVSGSVPNWLQSLRALRDRS